MYGVLHGNPLEFSDSDSLINITLSHWLLIGSASRAAAISAAYQRLELHAAWSNVCARWRSFPSLLCSVLGLLRRILKRNAAHCLITPRRNESITVSLK